MRDSRPHPVNRLFSEIDKNGHVSLSKIQQHCMLLLKLNRIVNTLLPIPLRPWCRVANIRQGILILETANANWKLRLYYEQFHLLSSLRAQILPSLLSIDIKINPGLARK
ncbi:hypothetical protein FVIR_GE00485 [Candidatus Gullanella endobia]|uniref:Zn-ribbon-containing, possibly RNA-binding protein and truncated derivatives n=1 Tax=Candidatus Gullanella endobia TaxID=1070130 RepID=A0A143WRF0_9ENTR|nr:hypothetical protein FVIR_GE00485 [Candidatus Gullanella endobia]